MCCGQPNCLFQKDTLPECLHFFYYNSERLCTFYFDFFFQVANCISLCFLLLYLTDSRPVYVRSVEVGDTVTLSCPERSKNPITWYGPPKYMPYIIDGKINPKLIDENIAMIGNDSKRENNLEIIKVSYSNQGYYRCRLLNKRPVEYEIFLTVEGKIFVTIRVVFLMERQIVILLSF